jgi:hypothetical protein
MAPGVNPAAARVALLLELLVALEMVPAVT